MRFSIVIPNYNSGPLLERALRSVLAQNYPDLQIILADAQSTDASRQTIEEYRHVFDPLLCEKDDGQADGLNRGFRHARGDLHGWLCSDDELLPGALAHIAATFRSNPEADVVLGACERIYPDGRVAVTYPDPDAWRTIGLRDTIEQPSTFWSAALHRKLGELDPTFYLAFDWDFWCRMRDVGARLVATDQVLSRYHFSASNKSGSSGRRHLEEGLRIIRRHCPRGWLFAPAYRFLYEHFDLRGCYDLPPTCSPARAAAFRLTTKILTAVLGQDPLLLYNLHFASLQERGLPWW